MGDLLFAFGKNDTGVTKTVFKRSGRIKQFFKASLNFFLTLTW